MHEALSMFPIYRSSDAPGSVGVRSMPFGWPCGGSSLTGPEGMAGFEPAPPRTSTECSTAELHPDNGP